MPTSAACPAVQARPTPWRRLRKAQDHGKFHAALVPRKRFGFRFEMFTNGMTGTPTLRLGMSRVAHRAPTALSARVVRPHVSDRSGLQRRIALTVARGSSG